MMTKIRKFCGKVFFNNAIMPTLFFVGRAKHGLLYSQPKQRLDMVGALSRVKRKFYVANQPNFGLKLRFIIY